MTNVRDDALMLCQKGRKIYIPSINISIRNSQIIAEHLLFTINEWDEIIINQMHCGHQALKILLTAISSNYQNLKSFSISSVYFGCLYGKLPNNNDYCVSNIFSVVQNLQCLNISHVSIDTETAIKVMSSIANNQRLLLTLKVLNLTGNPVIGEEVQCVKFLSHFVTHSQNLTELYLKSCSISNEDISIMSHYITHSMNKIESLEILDLSDSQHGFTAMGIINLLLILNRCSNIRCLSISHRNIIDDGISCSALWTGLSRIESLQELDISCITNQTFKCLAFVARKSKLMMKNIIRLKIKHTFKNKHDNQLYHCLNNILLLCPSLKCIDLSYNEMTDKQLKIISNILSNKLPMLKTMILTSNELTARKGCKYLLNIVNDSRKTSKSDIDGKIHSIMTVNKQIPKEIAAKIIHFTNGYQDSAQYGINEMVLFRNNIFDLSHPYVQKLKLSLQYHLF